MLEIPREEYPSPSASWGGLLAGEEVMGAVLAGHTTGRVFVPGGTRRRNAFVSVNGFCVIAGADPDGAFAKDCLGWLDGREDKFFILHPGSDDWVRVLEGVTGAGTSKLQRVRFAFDEKSFRRLPASQIRVPGYELVAMDGRWMRAAAQTLYPWMAGTWRSVEAFEQHGLGVCAVVDGKVASLCYSVFVSGTRHEIDILTAPDARGLGLGKGVASAFIERCLAGGWEPVWNCYRSNTASSRLAESLGFKPVADFPVFAR